MAVYEYQKRGIARLLCEGGTLLADDVGTGKSCQSLVALSITKKFPALVVTPKSVKTAWVREATRWCPSAVPLIIEGTAAQREKQFAAALAEPNALVIIGWNLLQKYSKLASYGGATLKDGEADAKELQQFGFRTVIADEAHRAKDPKTKWTRALWALGDVADYRWALTGTPIGNEHADLWAILRFIEPDMFPSKSKFVDRYVDMIALPWAHEPIGLKEENKAELLDVLDAYMIRRTAKEIPELASEVPVIREIRLDVELTAKQKSAYKSMKKEMMAQIGDDLLMADNPLVLRSRLRYIASSMPLVDEDGKVIGLEPPSNKLDALDELLRDGLPLPSVIFSESSKLANLAYNHFSHLGYECRRVTGAQNDAERTQTFEEFQAGKVQLIFGTAALAEGVTLSKGRSQVFLQIPSSLIAYTQMNGRVARIGNENPVIPSYLLLSQGTTDEQDYDIIVAKTERLEEVCRDKSRIFGTL